MSSYKGKYAEYYDVIYAGKDYAAEARFIDECLQRYGRGANSNLLELACGTGEHAFALEKLSHSVLATDYSPDLLKVAQRKKVGQKSTVTFELADMRDFSLERKDFDAAICLFDSIGYVQTNEAISAVFKGTNRHLASEGLFIFEFWHKAPMLSKHDPLRVARWDLPQGTLVRIAQTELNREQDLATVDYELIELGHDGSFLTTKEAQTNRFFELEEMNGLLNAAGFEAQICLNGYSWDETIDENCWHVLCVARKTNEARA